MKKIVASLSIVICCQAGAAGLLQSSTETRKTVSTAVSAEDGERGLKKRKKDVILDSKKYVPEFGPIDSEKVLPPIEPPKNRQTISRLNSIPVKQIKLQGSTVMPNAEFNRIVKPYLDKSDSISMQDLQQIRLALSEWYLQNGYVNSGVVIPDQQIDNSTIILRSIEGTLVDVNISGNDSLSADHLRQRILSDAGKPLNLALLQSTLMQIQQDPTVQTINAKLNPGDALGTAILDIKMLERSPYILHVGVNNYRSPSVGEENFYLKGGINNLAGRGDKLISEITFSEGITEFAANYTYPLNLNHSAVSAYLSASDSIIVEEPFDQIDIESLSTTYGAAFSHHFDKTDSMSLTGVIGLEVKHSESTLLEEPFVFSLGADENGEADDTVIYFSLNWLERTRNQALAWNNTLRYGLDLLDATMHDDDSLPDGEFWVLQSAFRYAKRINLFQSEIAIDLGLQMADDALLAMEKYSAGGVYSVRGYRENQIVRDSGYNTTIEWKIPIVQRRNNLPGQNLAMSVFYDFASAKDEDEALTNTEKETISSLGLGVYWEPVRQLNIELFLANALDDVPEPAEDSLQDDGIHLAIDYNHTF